MCPCEMLCVSSCCVVSIFSSKRTASSIISSHLDSFPLHPTLNLTLHLFQHFLPQTAVAHALTPIDDLVFSLRLGARMS
jgi:hypothetical protein